MATTSAPPRPRRRNSVEQPGSHQPEQLAIYRATNSHMNSRLISTLDALDALRATYTSELEKTREEVGVLKEKVGRYLRKAKKAEKERNEMRELVEAVLERVEMASSSQPWAYPAKMRLSTYLEPLDRAGSSSSGALVHHNRRRNPNARHDSAINNKDNGHDSDDGTMLNYAASIIESLRHERDQERQSHQRAREAAEEQLRLLEAQLARREAELEGCVLEGHGHLASAYLRVHSGGASNRDRPRDSDGGTGLGANSNSARAIGLGADQALDYVGTRNRILEAEIQHLERRLSAARAPVRPSGSRGRSSSNGHQNTNSFAPLASPSDTHQDPAPRFQQRNPFTPRVQPSVAVPPGSLIQGLSTDLDQLVDNIEAFRFETQEWQRIVSERAKKERQAHSNGAGRNAGSNASQPPAVQRLTSDVEIQTVAIEEQPDPRDLTIAGLRREIERMTRMQESSSNEMSILVEQEIRLRWQTGMLETENRELKEKLNLETKERERLEQSMEAMVSPPASAFAPASVIGSSHAATPALSQSQSKPQQSEGEPAPLVASPAPVHPTGLSTAPNTIAAAARLLESPAGASSEPLLPNDDGDVVVLDIGPGAPSVSTAPPAPPLEPLADGFVFAPQSDSRLASPFLARSLGPRSSSRSASRNSPPFNRSSQSRPGPSVLSRSTSSIPRFPNSRPSNNTLANSSATPRNSVHATPFRSSRRPGNPTPPSFFTNSPSANSVMTTPGGGGSVEMSFTTVLVPNTSMIVAPSESLDADYEHDRPGGLGSPLRLSTSASRNRRQLGGAQQEESPVRVKQEPDESAALLFESASSNPERGAEQAQGRGAAGRRSTAPSPSLVSSLSSSVSRSRSALNPTPSGGRRVPGIAIASPSAADEDDVPYPIIDVSMALEPGYSPFLAVPGVPIPTSLSEVSAFRPQAQSSNIASHVSLRGRDQDQGPNEAQTGSQSQPPLSETLSKSATTGLQAISTPDTAPSGSSAPSSLPPSTTAIPRQGQGRLYNQHAQGLSVPFTPQAQSSTVRRNEHRQPDGGRNRGLAASASSLTSALSSSSGFPFSAAAPFSISVVAPVSSPAVAVAVAGSIDRPVSAPAAGLGKGGMMNGGVRSKSTTPQPPHARHAQLPLPHIASPIPPTVISSDEEDESGMSGPTFDGSSFLPSLPTIPVQSPSFCLDSSTFELEEGLMPEERDRDRDRDASGETSSGNNEDGDVMEETDERESIDEMESEDVSEEHLSEDEKSGEMGEDEDEDEDEEDEGYSEVSHSGLQLQQSLSRSQTGTESDSQMREEAESLETPRQSWLQSRSSARSLAGSQNSSRTQTQSRARNRFSSQPQDRSTPVPSHPRLEPQSTSRFNADSTPPKRSNSRPAMVNSSSSERIISGVDGEGVWQTYTLSSHNSSQQQGGTNKSTPPRHAASTPRADAKNNINPPNVREISSEFEQSPLSVSSSSSSQSASPSAISSASSSTPTQGNLPEEFSRGTESEATEERATDTDGELSMEISTTPILGVLSVPPLSVPLPSFVIDSASERTIVPSWGTRENASDIGPDGIELTRSQLLAQPQPWATSLSQSSLQAPSLSQSQVFSQFRFQPVHQSQTSLHVSQFQFLSQSQAHHHSANQSQTMSQWTSVATSAGISIPSMTSFGSLPPLSALMGAQAPLGMMSMSVGGASISARTSTTPTPASASGAYGASQGSSISATHRQRLRDSRNGIVQMDERIVEEQDNGEESGTGDDEVIESLGDMKEDSSALDDPEDSIIPVRLISVQEASGRGDGNTQPQDGRNNPHLRDSLFSSRGHEAGNRPNPFGLNPFALRDSIFSVSSSSSAFGRSVGGESAANRTAMLENPTPSLAAEVLRPGSVSSRDRLRADTNDGGRRDMSSPTMAEILGAYPGTHVPLQMEIEPDAGQIETDEEGQGSVGSARVVEVRQEGGERRGEPGDLLEKGDDQELYTSYELEQGDEREYEIDETGENNEANWRADALGHDEGHSSHEEGDVTGTVSDFSVSESIMNMPTETISSLASPPGIQNLSGEGMAHFNYSRSDTGRNESREGMHGDNGGDGEYGDDEGDRYSEASEAATRENDRFSLDLTVDSTALHQNRVGEFNLSGTQESDAQSPHSYQGMSNSNRGGNNDSVEEDGTGDGISQSYEDSTQHSRTQPYEGSYDQPTDPFSNQSLERSYDQSYERYEQSGDRSYGHTYSRSYNDSNYNHPLAYIVNAERRQAEASEEDSRFSDTIDLVDDVINAFAAASQSQLNGSDTGGGGLAGYPLLGLLGRGLVREEDGEDGNDGREEQKRVQNGGDENRVGRREKGVEGASPSVRESSRRQDGQQPLELADLTQGTRAELIPLPESPPLE